MAYSKVERHTWDDERFRQWTRDTRDVWLYLLTCKHQNRIGCFAIDPLYIAADVRISPDAAVAALRQLDQEKRIMWDEGVRLVLVLRHLKHNQLENPNVVKFAALELFAIPFSKRLLEGFRKAVEKYGKPTTDRGAPFYSLLTDAIDARFDNSFEQQDLNPLPNGLGNGLGNGMPNPEPEPEPLQITDKNNAPDGASIEKAATGKRKPTKETWLTPFADEWTKVMGGDPNFGAMAKALSKPRTEYADPDLLRAWKHYLGHTEPQFASPAAFAQKIKHWLKLSKPDPGGYFFEHPT